MAPVMPGFREAAVSIRKLKKVARQLLFHNRKRSSRRPGKQAMDLYTRNILVGIFAVLVMATVVVGEMVNWTHCDLETAKNVVQKVGLGVSTLGAVFLGFVFFKATKKRKGRNSKAFSFFSHNYHGPKLKVKK